MKWRGCIVTIIWVVYSTASVCGFGRTWIRLRSFWLDGRLADCRQPGGSTGSGSRRLHLAFSHLTSAVMRGIGKPTAPMAVMLVCGCAIRVVVFMTIGQVWHFIELAYWIYPITWFISSVVYLIYAMVLKKKNQLYGTYA